jgi:hypothetical protein
MVHRQPFGRRSGMASRPATRPAPAPAPVAATALPDPAEVPASFDAGWTDQDDELEKWKRTRKWQVPWRQISLTASLCFGVASLVLPGSVNTALQWPLYALAAASFYFGMRKRQGRS